MAIMLKKYQCFTTQTRAGPPPLTAFHFSSKIIPIVIPI